MYRCGEVEEFDELPGMMSDWQNAETTTHQDHVIAHVVGATVDGWFVWDETAYLLLDIGFIWNVYLDLEMGLVPHPMAVSEMTVSDEEKSDLREDVDKLLRQREDPVLKKMTVSPVRSPIVDVEVSSLGDSRRLKINCEEGSLVVESSLSTAEVRIYEVGK